MATPTDTGANRPVFDLLISIDKDAEGRGHLRKVGSAWNLREREGFSCKLSLLPPSNWDGRFVMMPASRFDEPGQDGGGR
jgi:hypothetical protein